MKIKFKLVVALSKFICDGLCAVCSMDEHRCRAWWKMHKHHLRVGDAVVRYIQKAPQKLRPQQLGNRAFLPLHNPRSFRTHLAHMHCQLL